MQPSTSSHEILVWDLGVRIFHWGLVLCFALAYLTANFAGFDEVHTCIGYAIIALLIFRIVWGFFGSHYARFRNFIFTPKEILSDIIEVSQNRAKRHIGHTPPGSAMIFTLLIVLLSIAGTGLILEAWGEFSGPLWAMQISISDTVGALAKELHEEIVDIILILIALHILGVIVASIQHKESLVKAMITGKKRSK
ncbi:MAG: cytochrome b/b6 domain-containing protein [Zetaproteobacteria bacterium]|nr:cytochrome b/b6 domain-containing protein [Zetaproteobacteria bacterium]